MKLSLSMTHALLLLSFAAGCADVRQLEDGAVSAGNRSELATTEPAYYVVVRGGDRRMHVARVGGAETTCADRVPRATCEVLELDLSRADLLVDDEVEARAAIEDGVAIVRAKLVSTDDGGPRAGRLVASEVWMRTVAAPTLVDTRAQTDATYRLRDVHEACAVSCSTCAWLRAEPLGEESAAHYVALDLTAVGGSLGEADRQALASGRLLARGTGVGQAFVVASLYSRFTSVVRAPAPATPSEPVAEPELR